MKLDNSSIAKYLIFLVIFIMAIIALFVSCKPVNEKINSYYSYKGPKPRTYDAKEATQGVAVDDNFFYAINNNTIGKYLKKNGKLVAHKKLPVKHLNGGKIIKDSLILTNNPSLQDNALIYVNPTTLDITNVSKISIDGSLTWMDVNGDELWICSAFYKDKVNKTRIYCLNDEFEFLGEWTLPKKLLKRLAPWSLSGGDWYNGYLYVSGHDKSEIYMLDLPYDTLEAKLVKIIPVCFEGQGFVFEKQPAKTYIWGINRDEKEVLKCLFKSPKNPIV